MKNLDLSGFGVQEMNAEEMRENDGGFIPLVILGVTYSAQLVAAACGTTFLAGVAAGVACAIAID